MELESISTYKLISNLITVKDIAHPITVRVSSGMPAIEVYLLMSETKDITDEFCLVEEQNEVLGYLTFEDDILSGLDSEAVGKGVNPITPSMIISSTTPVNELPKLFEKRHFYFLLSGTEITHVLYYAHLDKLPMKFSLFSRFMEFEDEIINKLKRMKYEDLSSAFTRLSPSRIQSIHKLCVIKYEKDSDDPLTLLHCTNFADIKVLVRQNPNILNRLPFETRHDYDEFFAILENLRNKIAHSESILSLFRQPKKFASFIQELEAAIDVLNED